jgi:hypothetical protein
MKIWKKLVQALKTSQSETSDWVSIYQSNDEYLPRLFQMKLEDEQIETRLLDKRDRNYNDFGQVYIYVRKENEARALELISNNNE